MTWMEDVRPPRRRPDPPIEKWIKLSGLALAARVMFRIIEEVPRGTDPLEARGRCEQIVEEETRGLTREQRDWAGAFLAHVVDSLGHRG